jgi:hypothetical protein
MKNTLSIQLFIISVFRAFNTENTANNSNEISSA